jgi:glycosyltransferase involved in cell wall biosynthesis
MVSSSSKIVTVDIRKICDSGIGNYLINLLPKVFKSFDDVLFYLLVTPDIPRDYDWMQLQNVSLIEIKSKPFSLAEQLELPGKIPKESSLYWATQLNIPVFYSGKVIVTIYDIIQLAMPHLVGGIQYQIYFRIMLYLIKLKHYKVLTISEFTKSEVIREGNINADNITNTFAGVADKWFNIVKKERPHSKPYLLFVGNVKPHKNLKSLLGAYRLAYDKIPQDLVIVGRKEGMVTIDKNIMASNDLIYERVVFTGRIDEDKLEQYYVHADALILPSFYEGFGIPPVEAMACGCPTIVSNVASIPEVCQEASLYIDPYSELDIADKILQMVNDQPLRENLINKGRTHALNFTYEKCADITVKIIQKCIDR